MGKYTILLLFTVLLWAACSSSEEIANGSKATNTTKEVDTTELNDSYIYELPVIFHVLYNNENDPSQYIPYQRLSNLLQYINEVYQGGIYGQSENVNIKFVLATTDESGRRLAHPGVDYVKYTDEYPIDVQKFMTDNMGTNVKYIWEPNNYINIMMFHFKANNNGQTTLGISHMPQSVKGDHELEGLETVPTPNVKKDNLRFAYCSAINSLYANIAPGGGYYQSDRYTSPTHTMRTYTSTDIVITLAHELGHYLGLFHVFTERRGGNGNDSVEPVDSCADTDYCADTHSYNRYEYEEYLKYEIQNQQKYLEPLLKRNACDSAQYQAEDIMDYSVSLGFKITPQQKQRIRHVLYYSPLIPGPKKYRTTRAGTTNGPVDIKITTIK